MRSDPDTKNEELHGILLKSKNIKERHLSITLCLVLFVHKNEGKKIPFASFCFHLSASVMFFVSTLRNSRQVFCPETASQPCCGRSQIPPPDYYSSSDGHKNQNSHEYSSCANLARGKVCISKRNQCSATSRQAKM